MELSDNMADEFLTENVLGVYVFNTESFALCGFCKNSSMFQGA